VVFVVWVFSFLSCCLVNSLSFYFLGTLANFPTVPTRKRQCDVRKSLDKKKICYWGVPVPDLPRLSRSPTRCDGMGGGVAKL